MNIIGIILLTILITAIHSVDFKSELSSFEIARLGETSRKYKSVAKFIAIYPSFKFFIDLVSIVVVVLMAGLAAMSFGLWGGLFIALALQALGILLGNKLTALTTSLIANHADFLNKYFSWTVMLKPLLSTEPKRVVGSEAELIELIKDSKIKTEQKEELLHAIQQNSLTVGEVAEKWGKVIKLSAKDKLTPKLIDELFKSEQKVFPVMRGEDEIAGMVFLDDISVVDQNEKKIADYIRSDVAEIEAGAKVRDALQLMAKNELTLLIVRKNKKLYGTVSLSDIVKQ